MLDAVLAAPLDDAPRLAFAAACEHDDPARAALIRAAIAHAKKPSKKTAAALKALVAEHGARLRGDLEGVIASDWLAFDRGFLSACLVGSDGASTYGGNPPFVKRQPVPRAALASRQWGLVEKLKYFADEAALFELLPRLPRLRHLYNVSSTTADALASRGLLDTVESLALFTYEKTTTLFSRPPSSLRRLDPIVMLGGLVDPSAVRWIVDGPLWRQLEQVSFGRYATKNAAAFAALLPRDGNLVRVACGDLEFVRARGGAWTLDVDTANKQTSVVVHALAELAPGAVSRIVAWRARDEKVTSWLEQTARRTGARLEINAAARKNAEVVAHSDVGWPLSDGLGGADRRAPWPASQRWAQPRGSGRRRRNRRMHRCYAGRRVALLLDWTRSLSIPEGALFSLVVNAVVFFLTLGVGEFFARVWRSRPVAHAPLPITTAETALAAVCVVLNSLVMFVGWLLFREGVVQVEGDARPLRWLVDSLVLLLVMDLAMYATHRLAHIELAFRWVHGVHHRYDRPRPLTLFVLHPLEVLGFGGLWIALLCLHPFSLGGMLLYLTFNTTFGVVGHVGVEPLPDAFGTHPLLRLMGTSTFHARHHQEPGSNYGFYTTVWDRLFGTLGATYDAHFAKAPPPDDTGR